ncbi:hypothetical protein ASPZODRAFT_150262 [Penicilliopsis zonata CBS 506.65]|uniref:tRNA (guanine-N(7)-)-methyltransferase n=1 Tax=Penicilliopsis zonata CBS 506.65 TaxID=1073090 RepID=A0A1L9SQG2_9EURO|nr:hypothetical protein ASPZODRAFT_150262 [Penicilliopsis zonata CBS 506.65]OJJ49366.1 hypothetical protein ASPZODRAFT_150262 [Penicilliopsis zonata CBS 506.65]
MAGPPAKRQKREEYRRAQAAQNEGGVKLPQKKFYRQRAHANPFSDHQLDYPISPAHMDWASHFPAYIDPDTSKANINGERRLVRDVEVVDIGCGFGGLLVGLAPVLPQTLILGMEIRISVLEYVTTRIQALRTQQAQLKTPSSTPQPAEPSGTDAASPSDASEIPPARPASLVPGGYENISAIRSNTMKFFPNFFTRHQLSKIFICFPDPHFKARKHKARIISETLNAEYAYALRPGGLLYTITDVEEYHHWILRHFHSQSGEEVAADAAEPAEQVADTGIKDLWERVSDEELEKDECVKVMKISTEEGKKVARNKGNKYVAVFRRKADPEWPA